MMSMNENIREELRPLTPILAEISRSNVFSIPINYFQGLEENIMLTIKEELTTTSLPNASPIPFRVPEGYFDDLPNIIINKLNKSDYRQNEVFEELATIAPLLSSLNKEMMYKVPQNYFDTLIIKIAEAPKKEGVLETLPLLSKMFRYAVAAAIIGIVVLGTYIFTGNKKGENVPTIATTTSNIPVEVNKLSEKEIADYLDNSTLVFDVNSINQGAIEEINVRDYIKNISDEDIRRYLEENEQPQII